MSLAWQYARLARAHFIMQRQANSNLTLYQSTAAWVKTRFVSEQETAETAGEIVKSCAIGPTGDFGWRAEGNSLLDFCRSLITLAILAYLRQDILLKVDYPRDPLFN